MRVNIDAAIFLPGYMADGSEDINVPLLAIDQIDRLISLYHGDKWAPLYPYIGEALSLMRSEYVCDKTPLINKWVPIISKCDHKQLDNILCLLLMKYGWDIPQTVIDRYKQYANVLSVNIQYSDSSGYKGKGEFSHRNARDSNDFELSRILYQIDHKNCVDHLIYTAEYCLSVIKTMPKIDITNMLELLSPKYDTPSYLKLYAECVKSLVNMCILSSYINIIIDIPEQILNSTPFKLCLLQQPQELLNYYSGNMSVVNRFILGMGKKIPGYADKKTLTSLMGKLVDSNINMSGISLIGIPEMHEQITSYNYGKTVLGINPSVSDYLNLHKHRDISVQTWYCGALALGNDGMSVINRNIILKVLAGIWRMNVANYTHTPIMYIAEIAKRIGANMDDVLGSSYSMKMSNLSWALKDMPVLYEMGMSIGPLTTNMISIFVIKRAQKAQAVTGLQQMVEKINGDK